MNDESSSDDYGDGVIDDDGTDEITRYVLDDVDREYRRAFPHEKMT